LHFELVIMPQIKPDMETFAKIKVVGVGGGGGNAISRMVAANIKGVEFLLKEISNFQLNPNFQIIRN